MSSINKNLYIGVTNNLERRVYEHKNNLLKGFTGKYKINKLVFCEKFNSIDDAIKTEKKLKNRNRQWKIELIEKNNFNWSDISL